MNPISLDQNRGTCVSELKVKEARTAEAFLAACSEEQVCTKLGVATVFGFFLINGFGYWGMCTLI